MNTLLITHFHADHVSGLPDFLWGEIAGERRQPLTIAGPDGRAANFPSLPTLLDRLTGSNSPFPTLSDLATGTPFALRLTTLSTVGRASQPVVDLGGIRVTAQSVPHGPVPALAYRFDGPGFGVVIGGDQSGTDPAFVTFATGADVLVVHAMVNDRAKDHRLADIVALPERLGALAGQSGAKRLVLSHLMGQLGNSDQAK